MTRWSLIVAAAATAVAAAGGVVALDRSGGEPVAHATPTTGAPSPPTSTSTPTADPGPLDPALRFTQDAKGVHVHMTNRNAAWRLRNQRAAFQLRDPEGAFIRTYLPGERYPWAGKPGRPFVCCVISDLPPRGTFTLHLPPQTHTVASIDIFLRGGGWQPA